MSEPSRTPNDAAAGRSPTTVTLASWLLADQRERWRHGDRPPVEEYVRAVPALAADREALLRLIGNEAILRESDGAPPDVDEYVCRFPGLADELRAQFAAAAAMRDLWPAGAGDTTSGLPAEPAAPADMPAAVDEFRILGVLGRGGMGVVYKAYETGLKRLVAIKMLRDGALAGPDDQRRFRAEAEAVARLHHPNIVQVYRVGEHDGRPYLALEYVGGGSLAERLARRPVPPRDAAAFVRALAGGIEHAHRCGIVHRDLKPANILLRPTSESPPAGNDFHLLDYEPKVTDFGLAKLLDGTAGTDTQTGAIVGTPSYMAPEQAAGRADGAGPATDVYALGVILYECLTGRPPFQAVSVLDTLEQVRHTEPVPPRLLQPQVPRDLETVCLKCLRKSPGRRYADAGALGDDLGRFLAGEPIRARPVGPAERTTKWVRRHKALAALYAALVLAAGFAVTLALWGQAAALHVERLRAEQERHVADARLAAARGDWQTAEVEASRALAIVGAEPRLDNGRDEAERLAADARLALRHQRERADATALAKQLHAERENALFHATLLTGLDKTGGWDQAAAHARRGLAPFGLDAPGSDETDGAGLGGVREHLPPAERAALAAGCYELLLLLAEAEANARPPALARAIALVERAERLAEGEQLAAHAGRARLPRYRARLAGEEPPAERAGPPASALDWFLAGLDDYHAGRLDESARSCGAVLREQPDHFWARYLQGLCHLRGRRWLAAKAELTVCLGRRPEFPWPRVLRGFASGELGFQTRDAAEFAAARHDFDDALRDADEPLIRYTALVNRGVLGVRERQFEAAVADLEEATRVRPDGFQAYLNLAQARQGLGQLDAAADALDRAVARAPDLGLPYEVRAKLHLTRSDAVAAEADLRRLIAREPDGNRSPRVAGVRLKLGELLQAQGHTARALACYDAATAARPELALGHRLRAMALLALDRPGAAAAALDEYLTREPVVGPDVRYARGLLYARERQYGRALEQYTLAVNADPADLAVRLARGWTYLHLDAAGPALDDFEAGLQRDPASSEALCGRGRARARLGLTQPALDDAAAAAGRPDLTDRLHYHLACVYGQLLALGATEEGRRDPLWGPRQAAYLGRTFHHLQQAADLLPADRRREFWTDQVAREPALAAVHRSDRLRALADRATVAPAPTEAR